MHECIIEETMIHENNLLFQAQQIRELESSACEKYSINVDDLMLRAGMAAFNELQKHWPKAQNILVVCGKGNNAGDGYVLAKLAQQAKINVTIIALTAVEQLTGAALNAAHECIKLNINVELYTAEKIAEIIKNKKVEVIVDALLGTGLIGEVSGIFKTAILSINATKLPVLALDVPSGLEADTGNVLGVAVKAVLTVTFLGMKRGLFTGLGPNFCGEVILDNLNVPPELLVNIAAVDELLDYTNLRSSLPIRERVAHKGDFGHVVIIGGDYGYAGAVRMAAEAALRIGAGLVSVFTRPEHITAINAARPEIMCHGYKNGGKLPSLLQRATVIVIGPGLGVSKWSKRLFKLVLATQKPLVLDADALNLLAERRPLHCDNWVLTPHPGEAARLLNSTISKVQANRFIAANDIVMRYGGVCVLKGAGTLIAQCGAKVGLCRAGNPGMASGGMGDVLSGLIAGLIAQKLPLITAAKLGVLLHAMAGDNAVHAKGELGLLALDLLDYLPTRQLKL
jgi:ADP-dependent NAD(P)H-hydrate dehydratase / NAD(P)H-hydrate epimerase